MTDSILQSRLRQPIDSFARLSPDQRSGIIRAAVSDLNAFLDDGRALDQREAPERTRELAKSLFQALENIADDSPAARTGTRNATLAERIVTDALLRDEADRDQNVYLGKLFTRTMTRAVPDLIFQPVSLAESAATLRWAREKQVPVTLRGAASTAMGGAVPNDGGLTLDLSRLDSIDVASGDGVVVVGAGARLRTIHQKLAERGLALRAYPSNLGGTLTGWFVTGGIGMNAFGRGRALDTVRSADVVLPGGEHLRFHDDGRLDVPGEGHHRHTLSREESARWFTAHGLEPITLADLAGSEGVFGLLTHLTVRVEPRPEIGAFLLAFPRAMSAFEAASWVASQAGKRFGPPVNVKAMSGSHIHHVRRVWEDEDSRDWHRKDSKLSDGSTLPWKRIAGPTVLGAPTGTDGGHAESYLYVDFFDLDAARAFAVALTEMPGSPRALELESVRFAAERFRPQQIKRLGPGMLAAEIVMPLEEVERFIPKAAKLAKNAGNELDAEVYVMADGMALVIGGYLTDHRRGSFAVDLMIAPALVDLAMRAHRGRPYVLGRWQAAWARERFGRQNAARLERVKRGVDAGDLINRGVLLQLKLRGALGAIVQSTFAPGMTLLSVVYGSGILSPLVLLARSILNGFPGPAHGRGEPAKVGAKFAASPATGGAVESDGNGGLPEQLASARSLNCVNCGECNSVCPIFNESKIRLPQMLTHIGEATFGGEKVSLTGSVLLDLCMRCGNCEEVCQAGIPHLPLYEQLQSLSDQARPRDKERHTAIVASMRSSSRYLRDFLDVRPGGYVKRAPASLPGVARYVLMRAENDAGPAATCIHCGACVAVCPTQANREFEGADPRWITTAQERCVGCGTCVEVCPANQLNGGQTLRVMEAPTRDWFIALEEFQKGAAN